MADRIDHLADYMPDHSDHKHANLSATADIASEFVAELGDVQVGTDPPKQARERTKQQTGADADNAEVSVGLAPKRWFLLALRKGAAHA